MSTIVRIPLGPKNTTITGKVGIELEGVQMMLLKECVSECRQAFDYLEFYRRQGREVWLGLGFSAELVRDRVFVGGHLYIDHAIVATTGQISFKWEVGPGKGLCVHLGLDELEALAAT